MIIYLNLFPCQTLLYLFIEEIRSDPAWQWLTWLSYIDRSSDPVINLLKLSRACCSPGPELSSQITIGCNWNIWAAQDTTQTHIRESRKERGHGQKECPSVYVSCDYRCLTAISALSDSPDLYDHLSWQRVSPSKPSLSLTTWADHPGSCPSRRAPRCCCTSGRQKTGGRDGTMASTAWCHTSISWSKMCECFFYTVLNVTEQHTLQITYVWRLTTKVMRDRGLTWNYLDDFLELEWHPE